VSPLLLPFGSAGVSWLRRERGGACAASYSS